MVGRTTGSLESSSSVRRLFDSLAWYEEPACVRTDREGSSTISGSKTRFIGGLAGFGGG